MFSDLLTIYNALTTLSNDSFHDYLVRYNQSKKYISLRVGGTALVSGSQVLPWLSHTHTRTHKHVCV
jgi:hypothetical protein